MSGMADFLGRLNQARLPQDPAIAFQAAGKHGSPGKLFYGIWVCTYEPH
jgi:hypothetical protein